MHEKYASRHVLYPVPNVFVPAADVVVARATAPLRATVFVALRADDGVVVALRVVVVALRAVVLVRAALRAVAVRLTVLRAVVRAVALRDVVVVAPVRADVCDCVVSDFARVVTLSLGVVRVTLDALRTAASAKPMPAQSVAAKSKIFFILGFVIMIAKMPFSGQGLFRTIAQFFCKNNPADCGMFY